MITFGFGEVAEQAYLELGWWAGAHIEIRKVIVFLLFCKSTNCIKKPLHNEAVFLYL